MIKKEGEKVPFYKPNGESIGSEIVLSGIELDNDISLLETIAYTLNSFTLKSIDIFINGQRRQTTVIASSEVSDGTVFGVTIKVK
jgi:hypothetical protein